MGLGAETQHGATAARSPAPKGAATPGPTVPRPGVGGSPHWGPTAGSPRAAPQCDMQKLTVDELKRLLYDTFCEHLSMKDIENIIMTEEESHMGTAEECPVEVESEWGAGGRGGGRGGGCGLSGAAPTACSSQQIRQTCVRKSLICAFAIAFIISVMLIAANQVLRSGMK